MARPPLFQRATVTRIVKETADARTLVLAPHEGPFTYQAGQFCTFKVTVDGRDLYRSYSMSSAPQTDTELMVTVKRVAGGQVSNWLHDNLAEGDEVELSRPAGRFCLRESDAPFLGFSGGSGITPIIALAKSVLADTDRRVKLFCADRDRASIIFDAALAALAERYPDRVTVIHHLDDEHGLPTPELIREFVGADGHGDSYICGPERFMELVENSLPGPGQIFSERFGTRPPATATEPVATVQPAVREPEPERTVTIRLKRQKVSIPMQDNETLLESARRAGLAPPFSCEAGNCATCLAKITAGSATMRVNDALSDDEVADGYVLTCQAIPDTASISVHYED